ncbi:bile acid:sodium symporter family protein [Pararobbsia silviterrae]|nr:Na+-dependent transporter [Pararobbsia silviterrae]
MDAKTLILAALQIAIFGTVFTYGLRTTRNDLAYVFARPGLLLRSFLAMFVLVPLAVGACVYLLDLPQPTAVVLAALSISPIPPLLPKKQSRGDAPEPYGLGLLVVLALSSILTVPLSMTAFTAVFAQSFTMSPIAIVKVVLKMIIVPLAAGLLVSKVLPDLGRRLHAPLRLVAAVLLLAGIAILLAGTWRAVWAAVGQWTVLAIAVFVLFGLVVGHVLGGPDPRHASVLALATASRHPAIALAIASDNYPGEQFAPTLILYLILCTVLVMPYVKWQQRRVPLPETPSRGSAR